jgi:outer membrane protein assembly factor BamB/predicted Ser/Thr protein kinase
MPETTQFTDRGEDPSHDASLKSNHVLASRWKIQGVIGGGGMGTVYQARDLNFSDVKRLVAIKEMQTNTSDPVMRASMLRTFRREANILALLSHPAIPRIHDIFEIQDRAYLVMEYINGSDLELLMSKTKELPLEKVIEWAIDLAEVLDYLHNQRPDPIIFRDMKPSNVMIDSLGKVRLIDFGIARTFVKDVKGTMIGTEGYSAPEQYKGQANPQSDIYALGATLHHVLTRKDPRVEGPPFTFHERPIPDYNPKVPMDFVRVIEKALAYNVSERYGTCAEMKAELEKVRMRMMGVSMTSNGTASPASAGSSVLTASGTGFFDTEGTGSIQPRWTFRTEDEIRGTPTTIRDLALVGSYDSNLWAIKLESGELAWKFPTHGGIASSPAADEQTRLVVFGSEDYSIYAVDSRTGRVSWQTATKDKVRSTPRIAHNVAFIGSDDCRVYALNMANGRQMWTFEMPAPVRSRPFVTNELIIVGCESGEVTAITLSGARKWGYRTKKAVIAAPLVDDEGNCYIGSTDGFMYALDVNNGFNAWRFRTTGPIYSSPVVANGFLYFGSADRNLYCINSQNAREQWKFQAQQPIIGSPLVHKGAVYVGSTDETLYCLDAATGKERWNFKTGGPITSTPTVANDLLLVSSMDHCLYALPLVN